MKMGSADWIILVFIGWILLHNQLNQYVKLGTTFDWHVSLAQLIPFLASSGNSSSQSSGGAGGALGQAAGAVQTVGTIASMF